MRKVVPMQAQLLAVMQYAIWHFRGVATAPSLNSIQLFIRLRTKVISTVLFHSSSQLLDRATSPQPTRTYNYKWIIRILYCLQILLMMTAERIILKELL